MGSFGSADNYLVHVALQNAVDYFDLVQGNRESGRSDIGSKYDEMRRLLNAIESINNVPDWIFFDDPARDGLPSQQLENELKRFVGRVRDLDPCLKRIAEVANAYKHRKRMREIKKAERGPKTIVLDGVEVPRPTAREFFYREEDAETLGAAFRFWITYHNRPDRKAPWPPAKPISRAGRAPSARGGAARGQEPPPKRRKR